MVLFLSGGPAGVSARSLPILVGLSPSWLSDSSLRLRGLGF